MDAFHRPQRTFLSTCEGMGFVYNPLRLDALNDNWAVGAFKAVPSPSSVLW